MRILVVHPGASQSTHDVFMGLMGGLQAQGHELYEYSLDTRIQRAGEWLHFCWRRGKKQGDEPQPADVLYKAGEELVTRALRVAPDVVLVVSAMYLHPDVFVLMRRAHLPVAVLFTESPYDDERQVRLLPWIHVGWTNERTSAAAMGIGYLKHAWNRAVHTTAAPVDLHVPAHDVVFVGTGFQERVELLSAVAWDGLDVGLYGSWELLGTRHHLRKHLRGRDVSNEMAAMLYRRAKIGLNLHRQSKGFGKEAPRVTTGESLNPRAYELAAVGCFTVSDSRPEVAETFGPLVPTFATAAEVRPLLDRWLGDDIGRARIQAQLPGAVAAETWHARAAQIEADLLGAGIGARQASPPSSQRLAEAVGG